MRRVSPSTTGSIFVERCRHLAAGDRLYLHSDGLTDAINPGGEHFGEARLLEAIDRQRTEPLRKGVTNLMKEITRWLGGKKPKDDMSILAIEIAATPNSELR